MARQILPSRPKIAVVNVYTKLAEAHTRTRLRGVVTETPWPGEDETWAVRLQPLASHYEPLLIGPGVIFSSTMLLALAWILRPIRYQRTPTVFLFHGAKFGDYLQNGEYQ